MGFPTKECLSFSPEAFSQVKDYVYCNEHKLSDYYDKVNNSIKPVQTGKKMTLLEQISRYLVLGCKNLEVDLEFEKIVGANTLSLYPTQVNELVNKLKVTESGKAWIIDINKAFYTNTIMIEKDLLKWIYYI